MVEDKELYKNEEAKIQERMHNRKGRNVVNKTL